MPIKIPEVTVTNGEIITITSSGTPTKKPIVTNPVVITKHNIIDNENIHTVFNHFILFSFCPIAGV